LLDKGVRFISVSDNLDFTAAAGKLHFQILSAIAEFERELIRERTIEEKTVPLTILIQNMASNEDQEYQGL